MRSSATSRARATASSRRRSASGRLPRPTGLVTGWASTGPSGPPPSLRGAMSSPVHRLELDLDVFAGPFDLLLSLILREEVDLLEVDLADVVVSYLDYLEAGGELDLEVATEFLVLIAAVLELKSRLMLPGEADELLDIDPVEAADELLARMLAARRYRRAAEELAGRLAQESGYRYRSAPLPPALRRAPLEHAEAVYRPQRRGSPICARCFAAGASPSRRRCAAPTG